ncbi:MAG: cytidine deaminase [Planctomycetota bacterium]|jgi:cytidine deaminase
MKSPARDWDAVLDALPIDREVLLDAARAALANAHSPYSGVRVGATLVDTEGRLYSGCNVENASYGLTICAERNAIGRAVAEGASQLVAVVIATNLEKLLMPCGACRQVLSEFAPNLIVLCAGMDGNWMARGLEELLPDAFAPEDLGE